MPSCWFSYSVDVPADRKRRAVNQGRRRGVTKPPARKRRHRRR